MKMSEGEDSPAAPDSTTREQRLAFSHGEDVLVQNKDGKLYFGTIVEVDVSRERCLVKFMDNTSSWSAFKELTKLAPQEADVTCVTCKTSHSKVDNEIIVCDKCERGYHQHCHVPRVGKEQTSPDAHWRCKRCVDIQLRTREPSEPKNSMVKANIRKVCSGRDQPQTPLDDQTKLPYDPNMLTWDSHHRVNAEQIYCYCGLNGEWYTKMLQCIRCKQWFHEKCISCLSRPLFSGDRFYVFVCSMCNYGKEFVRRLELKWVDLVHLMLYNLTVYNAKKYYDLDTRIVPFTNENWHYLELPDSMHEVKVAHRREQILAILTSNRNRFKCGREIKKRTTIWGLRVRLPPPCPVITLPPSGVIDDNVLHQCWSKNRRLQYIRPAEPLSSGSPKKLDQVNQPCPEKVDIPVSSRDITVRGADPQQVPEGDQNPLHDQSTQSLRERYSGGGFVKKSFPFPKLSLQKRKRLMELSSSRERMLRKQKKREKSSSDKSQGVKEARFRKARKLLKNAIAQSKTRNAEASDLPPTPPTSVSGPPTPPATTSGMSELSAPSSVDLMQSLPMSTPADTSGDETSSRGTLDSFIPPPKDFEGKNNPFRNLSELLGAGGFNQSQSSSSSYNPSPITLPLPLTPVISQPPIVRPTKRQLSEKDIIIDRNGQVKRRRQHRRGRPPNQPQQNQQQQQFKHATTASKTAAIQPARANEVKGEYVRNLRSSFNGTAASSSNSQIGNCVDYALNGRRLRQRQSNNVPPPVEAQTQRKLSSSAAPTTSKTNSPVKQSAPEISIEDLKSSVNMYFGAANRIASGENFNVKAKRIGSNGIMQYLIEWDGPNT